LLHPREAQLAADALPDALESLRRSLVSMNEIHDPVAAVLARAELHEHLEALDADRRP